MIEADHRVFAVADQAAEHGFQVPRTGLLAGTRVESAQGWRPVEDLAPGDMVQTRDGGLRPVVRTQRTEIPADDYAGPCRVLLVPAGALGNCVPFLLMPGQRLLIEASGIETLLGAPFALVRAGALAGSRGITPFHLPAATQAYVLHFEEEEVVRVNTGVLAWFPPAEGPGAYYQELKDVRAKRLFRLAGLGDALSAPAA